MRDESASAALNMREVLFVRLVVEAAKYYEMRSTDDDDAVCKQRGIMRGMSVAITKMFGNGYEPYWKQETAECEVQAYKLAKRWVKDGKPRHGDWWSGIAAEFWRSASDAASPVQRGVRRTSYRAK